MCVHPAFSFSWDISVFSLSRFFCFRRRQMFNARGCLLQVASVIESWPSCSLLHQTVSYGIHIIVVVLFVITFADVCYLLKTVAAYSFFFFFKTKKPIPFFRKNGLAHACRTRNRRIQPWRISQWEFRNAGLCPDPCSMNRTLSEKGLFRLNLSLGDPFIHVFQVDPLK